MNRIIGAMIQRSGRSWWQAMYASGKVLSEWDTLPGRVQLPLGAGEGSRWEEIPKKGLVGLRLLCPNGMAGELRAQGEFSFFQLKTGGIDRSISLVTGGAKSGKFIDAHIIGVVYDVNGSCRCRAWDYRTKQLLQFDDNVTNFQFNNIGPLSLDVVGLR